MKIYVLVAIHEYEGYSMIKAFKTKAEANTICDACNSYKEDEPRYMSDMNDADYDAYASATNKWIENHPAGDASGDSYDVHEIELVGC